MEISQMNTIRVQYIYCSLGSKSFVLLVHNLLVLELLKFNSKIKKSQ